MEANYSATIEFCSKELTPKEHISIKDTSSCIKLDHLVSNDERPKLYPDYYAVINVTNPMAKGDKEYQQYIIVDKEGKKYCTGSPSFFRAFKSIFDELANTDEEWGIEVFRLKSRNYADKYFITCSVF